jgi:CMP-N,N'-diacetyllegionaminic acid synthase
MKILAIIPARCGSKGIPFKNIIDVNGKPLIQYSIDIALQLRLNNLIDDIIVSTDCNEIKEITEQSGLKVPFLRPDNISGDEAKSIEYVLNCLQYFESKNIAYDAVIILQPTSPLRTYNDVKNSLNIFLENNNDSLISAYKEESINDLVLYHNKNDNVAIPFDKNHNEGIRRQDHGALYVRNGAIYITTVKYIKNDKKIISDFPLMYRMSKNSSINVDTFDDLELVRSLLCK